LMEAVPRLFQLASDSVDVFDVVVHIDPLRPRAR
jgi:hypothetical protein